jgi:hypothetical protein
MGDAGLGTSEEVVDYGDLMTEEHETINEMRTDKAGATGDKNALAT